MRLRAIDSGDADYDACIAELLRCTAIPDGTTVRFYDVALVYNGMTVDPAAKIGVELSCKQAATGARVVRLNDGRALRSAFIRRKSGGSAARFDADRLGTFAVILMMEQ